MPDLFDVLVDERTVLGDIGRKLQARRQQLGLTQAQLALQSGVSKRTVERVEAGAHQIGLGLWARLVQSLEYVDGILPPTEDTPPPPPSYDEVERVICQGSAHPLLKEAAALLHTVGQRARRDPRLVTSWFRSVESALDLQRQLGGTTLDAPTSGLSVLRADGHTVQESITPGEGVDPDPEPEGVGAKGVSDTDTLEEPWGDDLSDILDEAE